MSNLVHLIYASKASTDANNPAILQEILSVSRTNNKERDLTGMLLFNEGSFFQILEGAKETVENLTETIEKDSRHSQIVEIITEKIPTRAFKNWSMGFAQLSSEQLIKIDGFNDFFKENRCLQEVDLGRAKKLLKAFSKGYWR